MRGAVGCPVVSRDRIIPSRSPARGHARRERRGWGSRWHRGWRMMHPLMRGFWLLACPFVPALAATWLVVWFWPNAWRYWAIPLGAAWLILAPWWFVVVMASVVFDGRAWRRAWRRDSQRCLRCAYDLRGLATEGTCPECGQEYQKRVTMAAWAAWLKGPV